MGSKKKIVSGVIWSTLVNIVNAIYGFISIPILINHFGKSEYGLIGLAMSVNVYMRLMDLGFNSTNVRFFSTWLANKNLNRLSAGFQTSLSFYGAIGLVNACILLIVAFFAEYIFSITQEQAEILRNLFIILALSAICNWISSCFDQLIKATENVAWIQRRTLITKFLMIVVLTITVLGKLSIELYYALTCTAALSIIPFSIKKIKEEIPCISFLPKWNMAAFKEMLPYSLNIFSFSLFQFSFYNLRPVFLGIQGTIESVADYRILNGITGIVTMLGGTFIGILLPSTSKIVAQNNKTAFYHVAYDGTKYISILINFCCFGMMSVAPEVLTMYVGKDYLYLIPWLNLWLLCTLGTHNQAISSLILAGSNIRAISYNTAISSVIGLILAWFLIPHFQIGGVCIAFTAYMLLQLLFYYVYYWPRKMGINSAKVFFKCFLPFVVLGVSVYLVTTHLPSLNNCIAQFTLRGGLFFIVYSIGCFLFISPEDRKFFGGILNRKRNK